MKTVHDVAKYCYEQNQSIQTLLPKLSDFERKWLRESVAGGRNNKFFQTSRNQIDSYDKELKRIEREEIKRTKEEKKKQDKIAAVELKEEKKWNTFLAVCESIEHMLCKDHILRNGMPAPEMLNRIARRIGIGCLGDLPKVWSGLVSIGAMEQATTKIEQAMDNNNKRVRLCESLYLNESDIVERRNTREHFYNMQYSGRVMLIWLLFYPFDHKMFIELCNCFRQVHITTKRENDLVANNGQNDIPHLDWEPIYKRNQVITIDGRVKLITITNLSDVAPNGLLDLVDEMFAGIALDS